MNETVKIWRRGQGEERENPSCVFRGWRKELRLLGAGSFRADDIAECSLHQSCHWRDTGGSFMTFLWRQETRPRAPWVPQHWWAWCVRLQACGPWDDGQRPRAAASLDRKNSTSVISAAESSGWPQKDSENAVLELHTGTCRFPEPILWSQSLLLTSEN